MSPRPRLRRAAGSVRAKLAAGVVAVALLAAGCSGEDTDSIRDQARQGDDLGYVAGNGVVQQIPPEGREITIELTGTTLEGEEWTSVDVRGEVLVVNSWGDWCAPCHEEADDLQATYQSFVDAGEPVQFMGVNVRDSVETARAFHRRYDITYPSLMDDGGQTLVALQGMANLQPTTLVIDREGRIAARVTGAVDQATLTGMVEDVLAE